MKAIRDHERQQSEARWLVLLRPDGVVESVEGGAPITWVGHQLADVPDVGNDLRSAARELLETSPAAGHVHRRTLTTADGDDVQEIELLLVEGLPLRRAHTKISELIMRTVDVFRSQAHSNAIDLTVEQAADVPIVLVLDGEKIAWALATLVSNALRFAERRTAKPGAPHIGVKVTWDLTAEALVIVVRDNGPGMSEHRARWLFDRDPATGQSAGLALLMVRDVMVAHRGSVDVVSSEGDGTAFTLRIPKIRG